MEIAWIDRRALLLLHDQSIADHGGSSGLRDEGLLDSALARPENLLAYGEPDIPALADCYAFRLAKNHPFVDGNKRTAFLAIGLFLHLNGLSLEVDQPDAIATILGLASGEIDEEQLADWIRRHAVPIPDEPPAP